jgi:predicted DNA-binding ribbon-helix-helix protein
VKRLRPNKVLMQSPIVKRSVRIDGRKTAVSLEDEFWNALKQGTIDNKREQKNLS